MQQPVQQQAPAQTTVIVQQDNSNDVMFGVILFVLGWCCVLPWLGGLMLLKSNNPTAKILGIVNVALFCITTITIIILIALLAGAVNSVASDWDYYYDFSYDSYDWDW